VKELSKHGGGPKWGNNGKGRPLEERTGFTFSLRAVATKGKEKADKKDQAGVAKNEIPRRSSRW